MAHVEQDRQPLTGRRIAITRPEEQARKLAEELQTLGAHVIALPAIAIAPMDDPSRLDAAIRELATYDWLVFTSANGVLAFANRLTELGRSWGDRGRARVAAIGPATAGALEALGVSPDVVPAEYVAEALGEALGNVAGQRVLLPRADIAREALAQELVVRGAEVTQVAAYRTIPQRITPEMLERVTGHEPVDAITFTSSSTVRALAGSLRAAGREPAETLRGVALAAIGPITAGTLRDEGLVPTLEAREYTVPGLVRALVDYFAGT
jgi:uroporphyrinogen III methyltransferase / synthase